MGFEDFEIINDTKVRCKRCSTEVERGIVPISTHWSKCGGSVFCELLIEAAKERKGITLEKINELKKHIH